MLDPVTEQIITVDHYIADMHADAELHRLVSETARILCGYRGRNRDGDRQMSWNIAIKRSIIKALPKGLRDWAAAERALSQVRAWVEHPFHVAKTCSAIASCATAAWRKTQHSSTPAKPSAAQSRQPCSAFPWAYSQDFCPPEFLPSRGKASHRDPAQRF
jgi:hypothetical protein